MVATDHPKLPALGWSNPSRCHRLAFRPSDDEASRLRRVADRPNFVRSAQVVLVEDAVKRFKQSPDYDEFARFDLLRLCAVERVMERSRRKVPGDVEWRPLF